MSRHTLISIGRPPAPASGLTQSFEGYLQRCRKMQKIDHVVLPSEDAFRRYLVRDNAAQVTLLDRTGRSCTSEAFAESIRAERDSGTKNLIFAIGPADGWSREILAEPRHSHLSFGPMTLPHELALVVLAEQVYRALTILAGHPYHSGH